MPTNRILIIVTNVGEYETVGFRTGLWLGEMTHFWDVAVFCLRRNRNLTYAGEMTTLP